MNLILTMAGKGTRMKKDYPNLPKWMIPLDDERVIDKVLNDRIFEIVNNIVIVSLSEWEKKFNISKFLSDKFPIKNITSIDLKDYTSSQVESALVGASKLACQGITVVKNIDTINRLNDRCMTEIRELNDNEIYLPCFLSPPGPYSFIHPKTGQLTDEYVIGGVAISGLYVFGSKELLESCYDHMKKNTIEEYNFTKAMRQMRSNGTIIKYGIMNECIPLGTPEEINKYKEREKSNNV